MINIANTMFGTNWKMANEIENTFDVDTASTDRNIRTSLLLQEAEGIVREVEEVMKGKQDGRTITHAPDSTTKKTVGHLIVWECTWARAVLCHVHVHVLFRMLPQHSGYSAYTSCS